MSNTEIWNKVKQPPPSALRPIKAGRLRGKTDINPQWRYQVMTEVYGPCGIGWKYEIIKLWTVPVSNDQVCAFSQIMLYTKNGDEWSNPIPGIGGSMLIAQEKSGLYSSDEAYKMATTDALSVAMKALGVGADVYAGLWDGSKYLGSGKEYISEEQVANIESLITETSSDKIKFLKFMKIKSLDVMPATAYKTAIASLEAKRKQERQPGEDG